ncbi:MAG TPA: HAMP domain-containing sensor histidine kinase, partial [Bacteroidales bacterium]|nr:HAMP domain-containing sensor histidine kinase [Bacteroidales bacterium]
STLIPEKMKEAVRGAKTIRFQEESGGKHFYNQLYPLKDDAGEIARLAVFIEDITEIQQIRELTDFNKELSELNRTKDRLISVIGHDLKSPLSGILNLSGLLSRNFRNYNAEKTETYLKSIYNTSEQILILLDNLLVWAKSRRGQMDFLPGHIMLNSIIPEISEVFRLSAENKNIKIVNNVRKEIFCFADQNMLKSILRNLVQNSIKFTNPGGWVSIDASRKGKCTEIAVEDNGVGFPEGVILIPGAGSNFSTDGTVSEKGTGLGLLLCREFIEKHNGHITIESEKNRGSRIVISLPDKEE